MALGRQIMREKLLKKENPRKGELFIKMSSALCQQNCLHSGGFIVLFAILFLVLCTVITDVNNKSVRELEKNFYKFQF